MFATADALRTMQGAAAHCMREWRWYRGSIPEVHCLGSDRTVPEPGEASRLSTCGSVDSSAGICALEEGSEGAEDAGAGAERHDR